MWFKKLLKNEGKARKDEILLFKLYSVICNCKNTLLKIGNSLKFSTAFMEFRCPKDLQKCTELDRRGPNYLPLGK